FVLHRSRYTAHTCGDARAAEAHPLEDGKTEAFGVGSIEADVGDLEVILDRMDLLADDHAVGQAQTLHLAGERRERPASQDEELEGLRWTHARGRGQHEVNALARTEVGRMHHEDFALEAELTADGFRRSGDRMRSEEVVDDVDRTGETEDALGFMLERFGDGCDRVR